VQPDFASVKPKLRGVLHQVSFFVSLVTGPLLVALSQAGTRGATAIYSASVSLLFGISALYHRPNWGPAVRKWLGKLDHTAIFVLIAGTFTPFAIVIGTTWAWTMLVVVWCGALLGVCLQLLPLSMPKPVVVIPYLALGWMGISLIPPAFTTLGPGPPLLLAAGGALYTLGAIAYAKRAPNPRPGVFGYHEVFHALVVVAAYLHYAAVAVAVS
jgi:hemolysin III